MLSALRPVSALVSVDPASSTQLELKIGVFNYPPHIIFEKNEPLGPLIRFLEEQVAPRMDVSISFIRMSIARAEYEAKNCSVDMIMISGKSHKRAEFLSFPTSPFLQAKRSLLVKQSFPKNSIRNSEDLFGLTVGWTTGIKIVLPEYWKHPNIELKFLTGNNFTERNVRMFMKNRLTAVASSNREALTYFVKKFNLEEEAKIIPLPEPMRSLYQPFSKCSSVVFKRYQQALLELERTENKSVVDVYREYLEKHIQTKIRH
jgi:ABC-type amino acid transport substrate-binding protein